MGSPRKTWKEKSRKKTIWEKLKNLVKDGKSETMEFLPENSTPI